MDVFTTIVRELVHCFAKCNILLGIVYPSLSVCIFLFVANHLRKTPLLWHVLPIVIVSPL